MIPMQRAVAPASHLLGRDHVIISQLYSFSRGIVNFISGLDRRVTADILVVHRSPHYHLLPPLILSLRYLSLILRDALNAANCWNWGDHGGLMGWKRE